LVEDASVGRLPRADVDFGDAGRVLASGRSDVRDA
jgi:hypothetical protein